jgi:hypothetical protein
MGQIRRSVLAALAIGATIAMPPLAAADGHGILDIRSQYTTARVAGDAERWFGSWDKEAVRMPPGTPAVDYATFAPGTAERFADAPNSMVIASEKIVATVDWPMRAGHAHGERRRRRQVPHDLPAPR